MQQVNYWSYIVHSSNTWEEIGIQYAVQQLIIEFKKTYDSVRREVLCSILIEFGSPWNL